MNRNDPIEIRAILMKQLVECRCHWMIQMALHAQRNNNISASLRFSPKIQLNIKYEINTSKNASSQLS